MPSDSAPEDRTSFDSFSEISDQLNADLLYVNVDIERGIDRLLIDAVRRGKTKENVILILVTGGGNADAAFKITRCLQSNYKKYSIFVPGWCKSAGTLIAIGAHTIYLSDHGELGPLDIQMGKRDELNDYISGLDLDYGIRSLRGTAFSMFEQFMLGIITKSGFRVTLKTAAEIASGLTQAYIAKIAEQISPLNVGETVRLMTIATEYGSRLNARFRNLQDESSLDRLVSGYSSHSFVIDLEEAKGIFERVLPAPAPLMELMNILGWDHAFPLEAVGQDSIVAYLRGQPEEAGDDVEATLGGGDADAANSDGHNKIAESDSGEAKPSSPDGGPCFETDNSARASEKPKLVKR